MGVVPGEGCCDRGFVLLEEGVVGWWVGGGLVRQWGEEVGGGHVGWDEGEDEGEGGWRKVLVSVLDSDALSGVKPDGSEEREGKICLRDIL